MVDYDVIIVGAGLSGLSAANSVLKDKPNAKVLILEGSDHIGGPIKTVTLKAANGEDVFDIGASRIGTKQKHLMDLIAEFGLETFEHYEEGAKFWQLPDGKLKKYSGNIPPMPYTGLLDAVRYFNKVDGMQSKVKFDDILNLKEKDQWDNMTVVDLRNKILYTQSAKEMVDVMTALFFGLPPKFVRVMHYVHSIATCGSWNAHIAGKGTGKIDVRIKGGTQQLVDGLSEKIGKENIVTGSKVQSIEQDGQKTTITTTSGKQYTSKCVITAVDPVSLYKIKFEPLLKVSKLVPCALYSTQFVVTYQKAFWREAGHSGELLSMCSTLQAIREEENDKYPLVTLFDHSSANGSPALLGIFGPDSYAKKSMDQRKHIAVNYLKELFGDQALNVLDYIDYIWQSPDEAPPEEAFDETKVSEVLAHLRDPHGRIHFAGCQTTTTWYDTLSGAVEAGQRAANEVIKSYMQ